MTGDRRSARVNGRSEAERATNPPGIGSVTAADRRVNVDELLELGVAPCGAEYFGVDLHLYACGRPTMHRGRCNPIALPGDVAVNPELEPTPIDEVAMLENWLQERGDLHNDDRASGLLP